MNKTDYHIIVDLDGDQFLIQTFDNLFMAQLMAEKVYAIINPPEVFTMAELVRVYELLNCSRVEGEIHNKSVWETSCGIFSVVVISDLKMNGLLLK